MSTGTAGVGVQVVANDDHLRRLVDDLEVEGLEDGGSLCAPSICAGDLDVEPLGDDLFVSVQHHATNVVVRLVCFRPVSDSGHLVKARYPDGTSEPPADERPGNRFEACHSGFVAWAPVADGSLVVQKGPLMANMEPMVSIELERVETLELLALVLAHLNHAEVTGELSARVPMLLRIRDKLALALREEP